jgi:hypothetical protein
MKCFSFRFICMESSWLQWYWNHWNSVDKRKI